MSGRRHGGTIDEQTSAFSKWMDLSIRFAGSPQACPYPRHRGSDWRLAGTDGPVVCGICHPPADCLIVAAVSSPNPRARGRRRAG